MKSLFRQPFAILGAFGLLTFAHDVVHWNEYVLSWLDAWRTVTRVIISCTIGWVFDQLHVHFSNDAKDYVAMGALVFGAMLRAANADNMIGYGDRIIYKIFAIIIILVCGVIMWPMTLTAYAFIGFAQIANKTWLVKIPDDFKRGVPLDVFFESFIWAAIIIGINYALLYR